MSPNLIKKYIITHPNHCIIEIRTLRNRNQIHVLHTKTKGTKAHTVHILTVELDPS